MIGERDAVLKGAFMPTLDDSGAVQPSKVAEIYKDIPRRRQLGEISLAGVLSLDFRRKIQDFTEGIPDPHRKYYLQDGLHDDDTKERGAEVLVKTMLEYAQILPDELKGKALAEGFVMFEELTGFTVDVSLESHLADLLPHSSFPRRIDFLSFLLEIRRDFIDGYMHGDTNISYMGMDEKNEKIKKARLLTFGLEMAALHRVEDSEKILPRTNTLQRQFTFEEAVESFQALTKYNLNVDIQEPYEFS